MILLQIGGYESMQSTQKSITRQDSFDENKVFKNKVLT